MKKNLITLILITIFSLNAFTCTTFVLKSSTELIFGRNLDWVSDDGIIVVNQRNILKNSLVFPPEKPIQWTSKYGSITFNQFGKEFPFGGINETGLVIEIMLADAEYPPFDDRPAINELQWIQYQLDNSKSIDDVVNSDKILRISAINQELHFLICDGSGNVAVIEFKDAKMLVYKDKDLPFPVLENDVYSKSLNNYKKNINCRFTTATKMIKNYQPQISTSIVDYSFSILDNVVLSGSWSIVYDIKNMKIHFKTSSNPNIETIDITLFDFDCKKESFVYDLKSKNSGNINKLFIAFDSKINKEKMQSAIKSNKIELPKNILSKFYDYHNNCKCLK
jgi:choloylglycine hydrolase